jgi:hypothetical protein
VRLPGVYLIDIRVCFHLSITLHIYRAGSSSINRVTSLTSSVPSSAAGLAVAPSTGKLYAFDNHVIIEASVVSQIVSTLAGKNSGSADGVGTNAAFSYGGPIVVSSDGSIMYVGDSLRIRKIVISTRTVTTIAGEGVSGQLDGTGSNARFSGLKGITTDSNDILYASESGRVTKIVISSGSVTTIASSGISHVNLRDANNPYRLLNGNTFNLFLGPNGNLFVLFDNDIVIFHVNTAGVPVEPSTSISSAVSDGSAMDSNGILFLTDQPRCRIRQYNMLAQLPATTLSTLAGSASDCSIVDGVGPGIRLRASGHIKMSTDSVHGALYFLDFNGVRVLQASAPCAAGMWCPSGSTTINQGGVCPAGYYCAAGADRVACPAGKYCPAGLGAVAQAIPCSAGKYCPAGSSTLDQGGACPAGFFCAAGSDRVACTAGMYCPVGSISLDQGGVCAGGYYCLSGQERVACVGFYCEPNEATANRVPCTQGYACPGGGVVRTQCTPGSYADAGASQCTQCPRGLVAASAGAFMSTETKRIAMPGDCNLLEFPHGMMSSIKFNSAVCIGYFSCRELQVYALRRGHFLLNRRRSNLHGLPSWPPVSDWCHTARCCRVFRPRCHHHGQIASVGQAESA